MSHKAYAAKEAKGSLESFAIEERSLAPSEILVKVSHCGICHSDVHLVDNDWQFSSYPLVPGHEVVGVVEALGSQITHLQKGQRVGVGWQCGACHMCEWCLKGEENLCANQSATCVGRHGGFASHLYTDARFAFALPEKLSSENVAPLLCGGITVYAPLRNYGVRPDMKVGVIGIGGLGHLAIQFAVAFGCEVAAFSSNPQKEEEVRSFGAHHFVNSKDMSALTKWERQFDFILSTANADLDWLNYVNLLRPHGRLCFVGVPPSNLSIPVFPLVAANRSVSGSVIGSRAMINEMLEFSARHNIQAQTEVVPFDQVNQAMAKVRENKARYRMVLEMN